MIRKRRSVEFELYFYLPNVLGNLSSPDSQLLFRILENLYPFCFFFLLEESIGSSLTVLVKACI